MATAPSGKANRDDPNRDVPKPVSADFETEFARLREEVARLAEQLSRTGEHAGATTRRAAAEGAEQLRVKGEAAVDALRSNANDIERQISVAVRDKPITSLAIAAGIGFFFALLSRR